MTLELLTLIALWCGQITNKSIAGAGDKYYRTFEKEGEYRTASEINDCRRRLIKCTSVIGKNEKGGDGTVDGCLLKEKL